MIGFPSGSDDADRMRANRARARDILLPPIADPKRRAACEADIILGLQTYFPLDFWGPFTSQRRAMVEAIVHAATYGGDQAIAAPRGEGKTSIAECVVILLVLQGIIRFPLITAATGPDAARILDNIKQRLERSEILGADYPEACFPIQALEGAPQRAAAQTIGGERSFLKWAQEFVVLPTVAGSRCSGSVLMTRGLDASIRGIRVGTLRPDLVVIDDPETRESVTSELQTNKRQLTIEQDLAGLGGPGKRLARIILTTIMRRQSLSDRYTDATQKPAFRGKRFRLIEQWPERDDLWDEYMQLRQAGQQTGDVNARNAHNFYLDNREAMDAGHVVANSDRFIKDKLPDGTTLEVSTLQHAYNVIADRGRDAFDCELQNDPPEESEHIDSGLTANRIQRQVSGYPMRVVPPGCVKLTQGIDVRKTLLHCVVRAWRADGTGYTIDHHSETVYGVKYRSDVGVDEAIRNAIRTRMTSIRDDPYTDLDGNAVPIDLTIIDAGWRTDVIYASCREIGIMDIKPAMGFGKSAGCVQASFRPPRPGKKTNKLAIGDGWFMSKPSKSQTLVCMDADRWKSYEHDRWLTPTDQPGTMFIWGEGGDERRLSEDERAHHNYAHHIIAEREVEEEVRGVLVRRWKPRSSNNHFLDASYMSCVAANMVGIRIQTQAEMAAAARGRKPRRSLAEAAAEARARG
jgi:hypothetical protein